MKSLQIEGFEIETNLDEQDVFNRMYGDSCEIEEELVNHLIGNRLLDFIEEVAINETPVNQYFYDNRMGYKQRYLEPFTWRANKKSLVMTYTGAMGGGQWYAKVLLS